MVQSSALNMLIYALILMFVVIVIYDTVMAGLMGSESAAARDLTNAVIELRAKVAAKYNSEDKK